MRCRSPSVGCKQRQGRTTDEGPLLRGGDLRSAVRSRAVVVIVEAVQGLVVVLERVVQGLVVGWYRLIVTRHAITARLRLLAGQR